MFARKSPTFAMSVADGSLIFDVSDWLKKAFDNPSLSIPLVPGKILPGTTRNNLLHRHIGKVYRSKIRSACKEAFGDDYSNSGQKDCDEYPFAATDERGEIPGNTNWAVKAVDHSENRRAGSFLRGFYLNERILDYQMPDGYTLDGYYVTTVDYGRNCKSRPSAGAKYLPECSDYKPY